MREGPAVGFNAGLGSGGRSVGVEVVGVGEVCRGDSSAGGREAEHQIVDVVDAVVASLAIGKDVAEGNVVSVARVGGEVDGALDIAGSAIVEGGDGYEEEGLVRLVMTPTWSWYLVCDCLRYILSWRFFTLPEYSGMA